MGERRCFGEYNCPKCGRQWMSSHSFADMGQKCFKCKTNVYPGVQRPLSCERSQVRRRKLSNTHPQGSCGQCLIL